MRRAAPREIYSWDAAARGGYFQLLILYAAAGRVCVLCSRVYILFDAAAIVYGVRIGGICWSGLGGSSSGLIIDEISRI